MKRFISAGLATVLAMTPTLGWADPPVAPPPVIVPLQKAQPAPLTGVLLSPEAVAAIVSQKDSAAQERDLAVQHQAALDGANLKFQVGQLQTTCTADKRIMQAEVDDGKRQVTILNNQLKQGSFSLSPTAWFGIGTGTGVVLTVLAVFVVARATK